VRDEPWLYRKALTRALNRMYTPIGTSTRQVEWTEERVNLMDFGQLRNEQQRALVIVYSPRANLLPNEVPPAFGEMIQGAKDVINIVNRILEVES